MGVNYRNLTAGEKEKKTSGLLFRSKPSILTLFYDEVPAFLGGELSKVYLYPKNPILNSRMAEDHKKLYFSVKLFDVTLQQLDRVLQQLEVSEFVLDSVIKRFEVTLLQAFRSIQVAATFLGQDITTKEDAVTFAFSQDWIQDESLWRSMILVYKRTQHPYNTLQAEELYQEVLFYLDDFQCLDASLKKYCLELNQSSKGK